MNFYECISRINSINSQYEIALSAFDLYRKEEETNLSAMIEKRNKDFSEYIEKVKKEKVDKNGDFDENEFSKDYGNILELSKGILAYPKHQAEQLKNSMRQNSLISIISTFEIFLNDFVRHILRKKPILLESNRKVEMGRLISLGFDALITEEVERQVYSLDRKSVLERSNYFRDHLKLPWGKDESCVDIISKINNIRNDIVHQDTDLTVNEDDLFVASRTCKSIVLNLMKVFVKEYKDIASSLFKEKRHNEANSADAKSRSAD